MNKYILLLIFLVAAPSFADEPQGKRDWAALARMAFAAMKQIPSLVIESEVPVPVHGNYCGPHHGDGQYRLEPVDAIDRACMRHDQCFDANVGGRYLSCGCDAQLVTDLLEVITNAKEADYSLALAIAISIYFTKSQCDCYQNDGSVSLLKSPGIFDKLSCQL